MKSNKIVKNASWIIGIQIVKALLGLIISMLTARYLGPSNFGIISYAASIVLFVAPIMYLGLPGILVQEIILFPQKEGETLGTAMIMSFITSLFCILGIYTFTLVASSNETETTIVCILYSTLLIFQSVSLIQYWFQAKLLSKYSTIVSLIAYGVVSGYKCFLLISGKSIEWFVLSNALDYLLISAGMIFIYKKRGGQRLFFSLRMTARLFSRSKYYILADMMVAIFSQTDRIMLKLMVNDEATGYYSVAASCAGITGFVIVAIIDSLRPIILSYKQLDNQKYEYSICMLYNIIIYVSLLQCIVTLVLSKYIVVIIFGQAYSPAIGVLGVIVWYTTFSYLGTIRNIWLLAENKQKYIWFVNLSGAVGNVLLNFLLIPFYGIIGAAIASLLTQIFTNVIMGYILQPIKYNNVLMLRALNPKYIINAFQILKQMKRSKNAIPAEN